MKKHPLQNRTNVQIKGGGGPKAFWTMFKKTALFWKGGIPNDAKSLVQDSFLWNLLNGKCLIWPRTTKTCDQEWQISGDRRVGIWFDSAISEWTTNGQWTNNNCICVLDAIMKVMHSQYVGISVRFPPIPFSNNQLALCQLTKKRQKKEKENNSKMTKGDIDIDIDTTMFRIMFKTFFLLLFCPAQTLQEPCEVAWLS